MSVVFEIFRWAVNTVLFSWLAKLPRNNGMNQRNPTSLMSRQGTFEIHRRGCHRQQDVRKRFGIHGSFRWLFLSTSLPWNFEETWKKSGPCLLGLKRRPNDETSKWGSKTVITELNVIMCLFAGFWKSHCHGGRLEPQIPWASRSHPPNWIVQFLQKVARGLSWKGYLLLSSQGVPESKAIDQKMFIFNPLDLGNKWLTQRSTDGDDFLWILLKLRICITTQKPPLLRYAVT